jgi:hypothetical protein
VQFHKTVKSNQFSPHNFRIFQAKRGAGQKTGGHPVKIRRSVALLLKFPGFFVEKAMGLV